MKAPDSVNIEKLNMAFHLHAFMILLRKSFDIIVSFQVKSPVEKHVNTTFRFPVVKGGVNNLIFVKVFQMSNP